MKTLEEIKKAPLLYITNVTPDGGSGWLYETGRLNKPWASVIWSYDGGWEHVSIAPVNRRRVPTWEEMCRLKEAFWNDDECVIQYHPKKSENVSFLDNCLHLWRPIEKELPEPPSWMVGPKEGESIEEVYEKAMSELE